MKNGANGSGVDNSVCYFLIHGFSSEVVTRGEFLYLGWAEVYCCSTNTMSEPINEDITDWIIYITTINATFQFEKPF